MKRLLIATVAAGALAFPAAAQQQNQQSMPGQSGQHQAGQQGQQISPSSLSESQIRELQQALNKQGFDAGNVDGKWGPETEAALRNFQQKQGMQGDGQLNMQTVEALGLDRSQFAAGGGATTTGSGGAGATGSGGTGTQGTTGSGSGSGATGSGPSGSGASGSGASGSGTMNQGGGSGSGSMNKGDTKTGQ